MTVVGNLLGPADIERATIGVLNTWMPFYLGEVERINELRNREVPRPPAEQSIYGGLDFESYAQDLLPSIITVCNPFEEPERYASIGYTQWYEVQVGALVIAVDEDTSRFHAGLYGAAVMGAILQGGYTEDFVEEVVMVGAPARSHPDEDKRRLTLCATTFHVLAAPIIDATAGPLSPVPTDPDAPAPDWPAVSSTSLSFTAERLADSDDD